MYSYDERKKAVELYIKFDKSASAVVRELGYPTTRMLTLWYREYLEEDDLHKKSRLQKGYTAEQKAAAIKYYQEHGRGLARTVKALGVEVRFEREGISSMDGSAEMAFSMLAVAAQEESRSISENMKWLLRKHAEQGIRHLGSNRILGYNEVDGVLVPNQDAWIVRVIFEDYATGLYPIEIHRHLMDLGAANSTTKRIPGSGNMRKVLSNEVYVGDRMIQKGPVRDLITKQPDFSKPYTSYYLTDDHEPIVDRQLFEQEKARFEWVDQERKAGIYRNSQSHYLYGLVYCSECGLPYRKGDGSEYKGTEYDYLVCSCRKRRDRKQRTCTNRSIRVDQLLKTLSDTLGLPWRSVEEFDSDALVQAVERVVIKPAGIDVMMKYRQAAND